MAENNSWLMRRVQGALKRGLEQAYDHVRVEPEKYLFHLRVAHDLPIESFAGTLTVPIEQLDEIAEQTIRAGRKTAAAEGAGFGFFGLVTLLPDLSVLAAITMRTVQKLSLIYGFEFNTDEEIADLWMAAATAAGVDISREFLEKEVVQRVVPRVIRAIAVQAGAEVADKIAGRIVPVASSAIGAGLNYYFVRAWGERAMRHFRAKHLRAREMKLQSAQASALILQPEKGDTNSQ